MQIVYKPFIQVYFIPNLVLKSILPRSDIPKWATNGATHHGCYHLHNFPSCEAPSCFQTSRQHPYLQSTQRIWVSTPLPIWSIVEQMKRSCLPFLLLQKSTRKLRHATL